LGSPCLTEVFQTLRTAFGSQHWWPAETPEEVVIGALLTQNTAWSNVEKAIANLRCARLLELEKIAGLEPETLEELIRPSGYFRQKSRRLKNLAAAITAAGGLEQLARLSTRKLRQWLLERNGVGPETADSILLYAFERPVFVIDAYTLRICQRHNWLAQDAGYAEAQARFHRELKKDAALFNEYHALLVRTGKDYCRPRRPACRECPLGRFMPHPGSE
jgi:endonuclease-3 related protein